MPGEDLQSWSTTAAANSNADTLILWPEGQPRASVNDSARSMMAALAKARNLQNGSIVTGGSANAQSFSSGVGYTTMPTGIWVRLTIGPALTNTSSTVTLNMDGISDAPVKTVAGIDPAPGMLAAGAIAEFLFDGTNWRLLSDKSRTGPQVDVFLSGSGTYTTPTAAVYLEVEMVGGGGGGGAGQDGTGGNPGGNSSFGTIIAGGGITGQPGIAGGGGTSSGATLNLTGETGAENANAADGITLPYGGAGGASFFGGAGGGAPGGPGGNATANTGSGGGGGSRTVTSGVGGGGGGAGGYAWSIINNPAATYAYTVGGGGAGGFVGAFGHPGGAGAAGLIIVKAFF